MRVEAYDGVTGAHIRRLPFTSATWSDSLNDSGTMSVDIDCLTPGSASGLRDVLLPWRTILAVHEGGVIRHAGYLTDRPAWDAKSRKLTLTCGGGMTILTRRLVMDHRLAGQWQDGEIKADEQDPPGLMLLHLEGSYPDIVRGLVHETMLWGGLPFTLPAYQGGTYYRNYYAWDMAYVYDRIQDITRLQHGPAVRFDPEGQADGSLRFRLTCADEIVDHRWSWDATLPGVQVIFDSEQAPGASMATQVYAVGGKGDDTTVMARRYVDPPGGMLLQSADTTHTTDGDLASLQSYATAALAEDLWPRQSITVQVGPGYDVHVGDWADIRVDDDYMGRAWLQVRVNSVDGSSDTDWLTLQCSER